MNHKYIVKTASDLRQPLEMLNNHALPYEVTFKPYDELRSLNQNSIAHVWYEQVSKELSEDTATGVKRFCKLHYGVPILRADDEEFRGLYDRLIKLNLSYEEKLLAMDLLPVTSRFKVKQYSRYLGQVQDHYAGLSVLLEFPDEYQEAMKRRKR